VKESAYILLLLLAISIGVIPFFGVEKVNATGDSWTTLEPSPAGFYLGAAAVDGKIYYIGGKINVRYDPETNTCTLFSPPPMSNSWGTIVACQNKIYLIGGNASKPTQVYDPATDTWENRTSIPTTRMSLQANVVDGKIYVIGGQMLAGLYIINPSSSNDVYDPATDSWSKMAPIPTPVMGYASTVLDNKIYIIGGGNTGGPEYEPLSQVQIFDPKTNQWTNGTSIPTGVISARAVATTGQFAPKRIYVIGGSLTSYPRWSSYNVIDLNQVYDPETDTWTAGTPMPTPRYLFGVAVINDEIYAIGGVSEENYLVVNEKYTPIDYIPEFPSWTPLVIMLVVVLAIIIIYRHKLRRQDLRRFDVI
jgi:N-acetylneuraminic acid mutarotase